MMKHVGNTTVVLGFISSALFFIAGFNFMSAGANLTGLRSVGGESVAEHYYQKIGSYGTAHALESFAIGFFILAVSLGVRNILKEGART